MHFFISKRGKAHPGTSPTTETRPRSRESAHAGGRLPFGRLVASHHHKNLVVTSGGALVVCVGHFLSPSGRIPRGEERSPHVRANGNLTIQGEVFGGIAGPFGAATHHSAPRERESARAREREREREKENGPGGRALESGSTRRHAGGFARLLGCENARTSLVIARRPRLRLG